MQKPFGSLCGPAALCGCTVSFILSILLPTAVQTACARLLNRLSPPWLLLWDMRCRETRTSRWFNFQVGILPCFRHYCGNYLICALQVVSRCETKRVILWTDVEGSIRLPSRPCRRRRRRRRWHSSIVPIRPRLMSRPPGRAANVDFR
ncbi:hypothetical protein B0T22DRAFT_81900 [Podospora appendiculata]|uniref:Uncharacterized protein n=1 Tax=Podospora appendiculata TaxID=314037 RepID=A0AAE1CHZ3_9PEZI|nr:hypothetical protein B0T22DRAFT_81900 [Podospora appendiculata]